ncbi:MAG: hypothetical protein HOQ32_02245 [Lysobacter sp.]|nr:hypothetical protein [Lysobacter sp.]
MRARYGLAVAALWALAACQRAPDLLQDAAALNEAQRQLAALPEWQARAPLLHSAALFHKDQIELVLVDPAQPQRMRIYNYRDGRWQHGEATEHLCPRLAATGLAGSDLPVAQLRFATVATISRHWYERARGVPGALDDPDYDRLTGVWFYTDHAEPGTPRAPGWATMPISGRDGATYDIEFGLDGSVRKFARAPN